MIRFPAFTLSFGIPGIFILTISLMPPANIARTCIEEKNLDPRRGRRRPRRSKSEPKTDDATKDDELSRLALLQENGWGVIEGNREELERYGLLPKSDNPPQDRRVL